MRVHIVRHGETDENKETKLMGRSPGNLSQNGVEQAKRTGAFLANKTIGVIYTSPLKRCADTTGLINEHVRQEIKVENLLIERDFGNFTNTTADKIDFDALDEPSEENERAGVEPLSSVKDRMERFLNHLKEKHMNDTVLVVSHNNPIRMLLAVLLETTYHDILQKYKIHNCGVTTMSINTAGQVNIELLDDTSHLLL